MEFIEYGSEIRKRLDAVHNNCGRNPEKMEQECQELEHLARKMQDDKLMGFVAFYRGQNAYLTNQMGDLFRYCLEGMEYQEKAEQWEYIVLSYNLLGITSVNQGNALFAIDYYLSGLNLCEEHNLLTDAYILNMNIGALYMRFGAYEAAHQYLDRSLKLIMQDKNKERYYNDITVLYISLANCEMHRDNISGVNYYLKKVLSECYEYIDNQIKIYVKTFQVQSYEKEEKYEQRDRLIEELTQEFPKIQINMDLYEDFYNFAQYLLTIKKYDDFEIIMHKLEEPIDQSKLIRQQMQFIQLQMDYYDAIGEEEKFNEAAKKNYKLVSRLEEEDAMTMRSIIKMRTDLELNKKQSKKMELENKKLQKQSETDSLTGMANRFYLNRYAEKIFQHCYVNKTMLGMEILDIDYFKQYNDNYGHQAGDNCIKMVAEAIKSLEKYGHIFTARYGGDEFVIIYDGYGKEEMEQFAKELKEKIIQANLKHEYSQTAKIVTVSQGICYDIPDDKQKIWDYLYSADKILYHVKKQSRNDYGIGHCDHML
ncbi:GGDEF domain-containing protein [Eubacterium oxidoreducens]|uniref:Diguanylate cyclase (GGDEF) domain-containing protein n=1 Tax=Eubacterium oxidoreducens TaxID=1732 RepID=A0A1G6CRP0_EUBOX|nr:GGDEF domain-containing protein [Eubacterium oxidoreducens]SDB35514.1 diguanylate cyclase (GGDEF) domain-containing protein [Eubacterium oxidoreducens]